MAAVWQGGRIGLQSDDGVADGAEDGFLIGGSKTGSEQRKGAGLRLCGLGPAEVFAGGDEEVMGGAAVFRGEIAGIKVSCEKYGVGELGAERVHDHQAIIRVGSEDTDGSDVPAEFGVRSEIVDEAFEVVILGHALGCLDGAALLESSGDGRGIRGERRALGSSLLGDAVETSEIGEDDDLRSVVVAAAESVVGLAGKPECHPSTEK